VIEKKVKENKHGRQEDKQKEEEFYVPFLEYCHAIRY